MAATEASIERGMTLVPMPFGNRRFLSIPQYLYAIEQTFTRNSFVYFGFIKKYGWPRQEIYPLQGKVKERWRELCEQAAIEQDPRKLSELVAEIDRLLEEKQNRLSKASLGLGKDEDRKPSSPK